MCFSVSIILLFISSLEGSFDKDFDLIEEFNKQEFSSRSLHNTNLPFKHFIINLCNEDKINCPKKGGPVSESEKSTEMKKFIDLLNRDERMDRHLSTDDIDFLLHNYEILYLSINQDDEVLKFIVHLKENNRFNYRLIFNCREQECIDFVLSIKDKIERNNMNNLDITYVHKGKAYSDAIFKYMYHIECFSDHAIVRSSSFSLYELIDEKRRFNSKFLSKLVRNNLEVYIENFYDLKKQKLIEKYLLNHNLLMIDIVSILVDEMLLNTSSEKDCTIPYKKCINILFYILKDSEIFERMVRRSIKHVGTIYNLEFRRILKSLEIDWVDGHDVILSNTNQNLIPPIDKINTFLNLFDSIIYKIRKLDLRKEIKNYRNLLYYFYKYLKYIEEIEVDEILEVIEELIIEDDIKEKNKQVFKRLIKMIPILNGFYGEDFYVHFNETNQYQYFEETILVF